MTDPRPFAALPEPGEDETGKAEPRRRRSLFPDGATGIFFLLFLAAVCGGLIAVYWPWVQGGEATNDRLTTLEARLAQLAAGHAPAVAAEAYGDEQKSLAALKMRLDADEARLGTMEKSASAGADLGALKTALERDKTLIDQLNARLARIERVRPQKTK